MALLEHLADQLSSAFRAEIEEGTVGWDVSRLGQGMLALNDGTVVRHLLALTAQKTQDLQWLKRMTRHLREL